MNGGESSSTRTGPRVTWFIDGFNLYHSIKAAERDLPDTQLKWLDIPALCESYLYIVGGGAQVGKIHCFSAFAEHLRETYPDKLRKHKAIVRALTARKVKAHLSHFQQKKIWAHDLGQWVKVYEEKETDVRLACEVLKAAALDELDVAILMTGDTDFIPLIQEFRVLYPSKRVLFAFPYHRANRSLQRICPDSFKISKEAYAKNQFPDDVRLPSGKFVTIPADWKI